jgi:iron complex transport system substrate-binding protein
MKKRHGLLGLLLVLLVSGLIFASSRVVVDMAGTEVVLPKVINRTISTSPLFTTQIFALHGDDKLVGIDAWSRDFPWPRAVGDKIKQLPVVGNQGAWNTEEILKLEPQVMILWTKEDVELFRRLGIPSVFTDIQITTNKAPEVGFRFVAEVLGIPEEGERLAAWFEGNMALAQERTGNVPEHERPIVYYMRNGKLATCGGDFYINTVVEKAGGRLASRDLKGSSVTVSMEQVLTWNPQVILIDPRAKLSLEDVLTDPVWQDVAAVKDRKVYSVPLWYRSVPGPEASLAALWMGKEMYPDKFQDIQVEEELDRFYREFYQSPYGE